MEIYKERQGRGRCQVVHVFHFVWVEQWRHEVIPMDWGWGA